MPLPGQIWKCLKRPLLSTKVFAEPSDNFKTTPQVFLTDNILSLVHPSYIMYKSKGLSIVHFIGVVS